MAAKKKTDTKTISTAAASEPLLVEMWPVSRPIPYARNARIVSARAVDTLAASIKEFGWRQPIVVDKDDVIIVGHTRLLAAKKLGLEKCPVHVATTLTPGQVKAYRLMDNRVADETEWDIELVETEMMELQQLEMDLSLTGFTQKEVEALFASGAGLTEPDAVPDVPEKPVTIAGDLWILGGTPGGPTCPHCGTVN